MSSAAVELATDIFDHLTGKTAMLIGTGKMGALAARHLMGAGVGNLIATNRTFERAVDVAREFNATPVPFEQFPKYLPMADIVIGSAAASEFVLGETQVQEALQQEQTAGPFMFRILKALVTLILFAFLGLVAYAYLGDLQPVRTDVSQPVELNVDQ